MALATGWRAVFSALAGSAAFSRAILTLPHKSGLFFIPSPGFFTALCVSKRSERSFFNSLLGVCRTYREAVTDLSPGLQPWVFATRTRPERPSECDGLSTWIAKYSFSPVPVGRPFRADFDGAFPGLKAWAVLLNRFAVRLCIKIRAWAGLISVTASRRNPTDS